jgi:hypothetical protein
MVTHMELFPIDDYTLASSVYSRDAKRSPSTDEDAEQRLEVFVIYTDAQGTVAAIKAAEGLAQQLEARLRLVMPFEVSYSLPLTKPQVPVEFLEGQLRELTAKTGLEVDAQVCLCRHKASALGNLLPPNSLIVLGAKKHWWPTAAQRLSLSLMGDGHKVILLPI